MAGCRNRCSAAAQGCAFGIGRAMGLEHDALRGHQAQNDKPGDAEDRQRRAPAERRTQRVAQDRRESVSEIAADPVRAVRVTEPLGRDVRVEDREIRGMEHAVADSHQRGDRIEPVDAGHEARDDRSAGEQAQSAKQHRTGAEAVDGESGRELRDAAREVKNAGERAERRERDVELGAAAAGTSTAAPAGRNATCRGRARSGRSLSHRGGTGRCRAVSKICTVKRACEERCRPPLYLIRGIPIPARGKR